VSGFFNGTKKKKKRYEDEELNSPQSFDNFINICPLSVKNIWVSIKGIGELQ
jgi:hypothetical protein